jgi:hypothetical protein
MRTVVAAQASRPASGLARGQGQQASQLPVLEGQVSELVRPPVVKQASDQARARTRAFVLL